MSNLRSKRTRKRSLQVALIAVMAATIEVGKLALAAIPNVEVVTLFVALFGYAFGWMGLVATLVFVWLETMIWGFNTWVLSYLIHWPAICLTFWLLGKCKVRNIVVITLAALVLTTAFGVSSSLIDVGLFVNKGRFGIDTANYWHRFAIYYANGTWFYVAQIVTNAITFPVLFLPLRKVLFSLSHRLGIDDKPQDIPREPADLPDYSDTSNSTDA